MNQSGRMDRRTIWLRILPILLALMLLAGVSACSSTTVTKVTAVSLPKKAVTLQAGGTYQLYPVASPSTVDAIFSYQSSNPSVATVNTAGLVTAVADGTATVTASSGGKSAPCAVTVSGQASSSSSSLAVSNTSWTNKHVPVLMYHSISVQAGNNLCVPPALFGSEMKWLHDNGYTSLSMDELYAHIQAHSALPDKVVVITLDDGYFDNYTNAYPILKQYGLKATVFMISEKIGTSNYMVASQLKEMSQNGIQIEDHTVTHAYLSKLTYAQQVAELQNSKTAIEQITGQPVDYVAYPYGDYNANTLKATQAIGYKLGFLEDGGTATVSGPQYEVRRSYVSAKNNLNAFIQIVQAQ